MNKMELEKLFHQYGVFDAAQYIISARDSIINACYYKDIVVGLNQKIHDEHEDWLERTSLVPIEENPKVKKILFDKRPDFNIDIAGVIISEFAFQKMIIKAFFQECRNALDILAQAANAACLAFRAKRIETVDFRIMKDVFHQQTYSNTFPDMCKWFEDVFNSSEYSYVDNYCNRSKHTCSVQTKFQLPIFGETTQSEILPFFRENSNSTVQQDKQEVDSFISQIYDFFSKAYSDFVTIIKQEITKKAFLGNRYYSLAVYQQRFKADPSNDFSMAYIECANGVASMPEEIQVLFIREMQQDNGTSHIFAKNCPFHTIYIKDTSTEQEHEYIGKYVAENEIGEDELYRFRKYKKVVPPLGSAALWIEAMSDTTQQGIFYHSNPFINVTTCSDDDDFLNRVALPI